MPVQRRPTMEYSKSIALLFPLGAIPFSSGTAFSLRALDFVEWPWWACALAGPTCASALYTGFFLYLFARLLLHSRKKQYYWICVLMVLTAIVFFWVAAWKLTPYLGIPAGLIHGLWVLPSILMITLYVGTICILPFLLSLGAVTAASRRGIIILVLFIAAFSYILSFDIPSQAHGADWLWEVLAVVFLSVSVTATILPTLAVPLGIWHTGLPLGSRVLSLVAFGITVYCAVRVLDYLFRLPDTDWFAAFPGIAVIAGFGLGAIALIARMVPLSELASRPDEQQGSGTG